jgi:acetylornithine deacetylase/succinyl-diaminopimelate desuccinylase-like protein
MVIEGSEESGSPHLIPYINSLKDRIGVPDLMVCLDSGAQDYERLWITTNLRGCIALDLNVKVLEEGVHSGAGTGLAADSFMIIRNLLERVEDSKTGRINEIFHVEIPQQRIDEARKISGDKIMVQADGYPMSGGEDDYNTTLQAVSCADVINKKFNMKLKTKFFIQFLSIFHIGHSFEITFFILKRDCCLQTLLYHLRT